MDGKCVTEFEEMKLRKKIKYILYKLNDTYTEIVIDKTSLGGDYEDFVEDLPSTECRWGVFDLEYKPDGEGEGKRNKLIFVSWYVRTIVSFLFSFYSQYFFFLSFCFWGLAIACGRRSPDTAKTKNKMVAASSRDAIRRALTGITVEVQATEYSEVEKETGTSHPPRCSRTVRNNNPFLIYLTRSCGKSKAHQQVID